MDLIGKPVLVSFREVLEDDYKDSSKSRTVIDAQHFANATTRLTRSEVKKGETEPTVLPAFDAACEKDPILDKRKNSKGSMPAGGGSTPASTATASF